MSGHIWFADLAIFTEKRRADRIRSAAMKSAAEGDDVLAAHRHPRHAHRIFVRFGAGVAEERLGERRRRTRNQFFCRACPSLGIDEIGIEKKFSCLLANRRDYMRMTMARRGDRVATVQIKIS